MGMKKQLLQTLAGLQDKGVDLSKTPALFTWSYSEEPYVQFQLLIKETTDINLTPESPVH